MSRKNIEDIYPLSPMQQGMLFHSLSDPASDVYFVQLSCVLRGDLDSDAFEQAFHDVVARHAILRTGFVWEKVEAPLQVVRSRVKLPLQKLDLRGLSPEEQASRVSAFESEDRARGFNVAKAPLMRIALLRLSDAEYRFVWSRHHLLLDGWSTPFVIREVLSHYAARVTKTPLHLPAPRPFGEFVAWIEAQDKERVRTFWRDLLKGFTTPTAIPAPLAAPLAEGEPSYGEASLALSEGETEVLRAFAKAQQITLNTLLQAVWGLFLSRLSGEDDVVFGATVSGRSAPVPGIEQMVGLFINTLPVRVVVDDASVTAFLKTLQDKQAEQRELEFSPLAEVQSLSGIPRGQALFDSIVVFENFPIAELSGQSVEGLELASVETDEATNYPLALVAAATSTLSMRLLYDRRRFDEAFVSRTLGQVSQLLRAIAASADRPLREVSLLSEAERKRVVVDFNDTARDYPQGETLHGLFEAQVDRTPDAPALSFDGETLTYSELNARANRLAHGLRALGVGPDALVGVLMHRSIELVVALYGILKAGGAYLPLDPDYPAERLAFMAEDAAVSVLLTQPHLAAAAPAGKASVVSLDASISAFADQPSDNPSPLSGERNLAYAIYTSGSTGKPKGAMNEHRGVVNRLVWMQEAYSLTASDAVLQKTPFSFDVSVWELFWPLLTGARLFVAKPEGHKDSDYLVRVIREQTITTLHFVPSMLQAFLEDPGAATLPTLRQVFCSGEALTAPVRDRFFEVSGAALHNLYGPTEAAIDVTYFACERGDERPFVPIGRPVANTQVYLLDKRNAPVPVGAPGELCIGGVQVARGYLNRPELTAERFVADPFSSDPEARLYRTGDLARYLPDGNIEYLGRIDHQVKLRGFRIELGEIEASLLAHEAVREAAVVVSEGAAGKRLVAYVTFRKDTVSSAQLSAFLGARLPEYMVPGVYVTLDALPLTSSGKVDRRALPAAADVEVDAESGYEPPRNRVESVLAEVWSHVLRVPHVGIHDDFFRLGGDSILSIQIVSRARQAGVRLTPRQMFEHTTVAKLAAVADAAEALTIDQGPVTGEAPLSPIQAWFFEGAPVDPQHFNQSFLFTMGEKVDAVALEAAVTAVVRHHDALRLRVIRGESGLRQVFSSETGEGVFTRVDLASVPEAGQSSAIEQRAAEAQASLDLERGPIARFVLFDCGPKRPARLLIVVHHLAVDGVSWRVLLDDLQAAYGRALSGAPASLPPKTTSFKAWTERLVDYAKSSELAAAIEDYRGSLERASQRLPVDHPEGDRTRATEKTLSVALSEADTRALLTEVPDAYRTQINDVLLTALAETLAGFAGGSVLIDLEGHGREDLFDDVDVTRTVGWFTTVYPVALALPEGAPPGEALKSVKEQLRAVPGRGLGYGLVRAHEKGALGDSLRAIPAAEVLFNYLGQVDGEGGGSVFSLAPESSGQNVSPRAQRRHALEINAAIAGGRLTARFSFGAERHDEATIEALAEGFQAALSRLIRACQSPDAGGRTPSDFALTRLSQPEVDALVGTGRRARDVEDIYPLSPMQFGMLFHTLREPETGAYFEELASTLEGLDLHAFERAWEDLLARHTILRTAFVWEGVPRPLQIVKKRAALPLFQEDLRSLSESAQKEAIDRIATESRARGFALDEAPLLRLHLLRLTDSAYRFVWSFHHLLLDGWAVPILLKELFTLYDAHRANTSANLPDARPYAEHIAWLEKQDPKQAEAFWQKDLEGFSTPTTLAASRAADVEPGFEEAWVALPAEVSAALSDVGRRFGLTMNTVVQGAFALLLSRYVGESDVLFGATVSGRSAPVPGIESMMGMMINTLPVRVKVDDAEEVSSWLSNLQARQARVRDFEHTPLVEIQGLSEVPRGTPLFEALVVFENYPVDESFKEARSVLTVRDVEFRERTNYPLTLTSWFKGRLDLRFTYDRARFDAATIERMSRHLATILAWIGASSSRRLGEVNLLSADERALLLTGWNDTREDYPKGALVYELITAQASQTPDAPAVFFEDETLTYAALEAESNQLARHLSGLGVGPGALVGLFVSRSAKMVVAMLAIAKAGGAYVPLDPDYPEARLAFILEDAGAPVLVTEASLSDRLPGHVGERVRLDADWPVIAQQSREALATSAGPHDLVYAIYTSGSTGKPKGVGIPHQALTNFVLSMRKTPGVSAQDRLLSVTSLSFDIAGLEIYVPLVSGGSVDIAHREVASDGARLAERLAKTHATIMQATPATWRMLLDAGFSGQSDLTMLCGGEALPRSLADALLGKGAALWNMFGPTETTIWSAVHRVAPGVGPVPIGRPIANTTLYVLDARMEPSPIGAAGELFIGGDGLARGYLGRPELTAERFVASPFTPGERLYRTGDRAKWLPTGEVEFLGRLDFQVKIRGFRIELGEIEEALVKHPVVREAVVLVREDVPSQKRLVAYVLTEGGQEVSSADVRAFLRDALPEYMVPQVTVVLDRFPLTPNGKTDRRAMPAPSAESFGGSEAKVAPRNEAEAILARVFAEVLGKPEVSIHDNFFELGGDSILGIQIVSRARTAGVFVTPRQMFEHTTVAELAAVAEAKGGAAPDQGPVTGEAPLSPIQRWFFERRGAAPQHFNQTLLLASSERLDPVAMSAAVGAIVRHHDALRATFPGDGTQVFSAPASEPSLDYVDLSQVSAEERARAIEGHARAAQASLDLQRGPVFRFVLFDLGAAEPQRLLVAIHHLVVDGVSLRILLADLWAAYEHAKAGLSITLGEKTTSFKAWAERLSDYAKSEAAAAEADYWLGVARSKGSAIPVDSEGAEATQSSSKTIEVALDEAQTRALLTALPDVYRTQVNDALLTALSASLERWAGGSVVIDLEGHGREALFSDVDTTRTVGWFTTMYPVALRLPEGSLPLEALRSVKEQLRAIPSRGAGYGVLRYLTSGEVAAALSAAPAAEVLFNYLGQVDQALPASSPLSLARESSGRAESAEGTRRHAIEVNAAVSGGRLTAHFRYSESLHQEATVRRLAEGFRVSLTGLIAASQAPGVGGRTPSDFELAELSQAEIDAVIGTGEKARAIEDVYPLSPMQQGMLFHTLREPEVGAYYEELSATLEGLDVAAFERAFGEIIARHAILRTSFAWQGRGEPLQIVHKQVTLPLSQQDLRGLSPEAQEEALARLSIEGKARGFSLSEAPLMRLHLIRLSEGAHRFVWSFHHLLLDGWSVPLLLQELFELYDARVRGREAVLPKAAPYRAHIAWLKSQDPKKTEAFWRENLEGFSTPTPLVAERRPGTGEGESGTEDVWVTLAPEVSSALTEMGRRFGLTMSTLVQGAFALLLARTSGEDDVLFGATVSGRSAPTPGIDAMMGLLINTVPVRVRMDEDAAVSAWLGDLQAAQVRVRELEHSPLAVVQRFSDVPRDKPLFESLVVFENYPIDESLRDANAVLPIRDVTFTERTSYPLTLTSWFKGRLDLRLTFDRKRFEASAIARMGNQLATALAAIAKDASRPVSSLSILPEDERALVVTAWNDTHVDYAPNTTLHGLFEAQVARTPDAPALTFEGETLSYGELDERANRVAHGLRALGIGPDKLVGVLMHRSIEMVVALYGILKAGGAYLPMDPDYPADRLAFMAEDAQVSVMVTQAGLIELVPAGAASVVYLDAEASVFADQPWDRPSPAATARNLAYAIYTSGSTGKPKGAMNEHRGVVNRLLWMQGAYGLGAGDVVLQKTPFSFDVSVWEFFWPLLFGAHLVVARPDGHKDTGYLVSAIRAHRVTTLHFVPSMLQAFLEDRGASDLPSLRRVFCSGEALSPPVRDRFFEVCSASLHNLYGPTEAAIDVTYFECERGDTRPFVPIGRPVANTKIYLLDKHMTPVVIGAPGELYIGGVQVARGYLNRPGLTAERFVRDPFSQDPEARLYRTGDLARYLPDGVIEYLGRVDFQVKLRGFRIELGEIEASLLSHPAVREAAVVVTGEGSGQRLVACVALRDETVTEAALSAFLSQRLPDYMVPTFYVMLSALPLTSSGKVDRRALRGHDVAPAGEKEHVAPRSPVEEALVTIWAEVLGAPRVGVTDDFFALGGHSLLATQIVSRVRSTFSIDLEIRALFEARSVAALGLVVEAALREEHGLSAPPIVARPREGEVPLSYAQERLWFFDQLEPDSSFYNVPFAVRLTGRLDVEALRYAVREVVARHEVLRTTFGTVKGRPIQVIHEKADVPLAVFDLRELPELEREESVREHSLSEALDPFDLAEGPLLRARLLRLDEASHLLVGAMHHIVCDVWTIGLLTREIALLYGAVTEGVASRDKPSREQSIAGLSDLPIQYADYASWQRDWLKGEVLDRQLAYWTKLLEGAPEAIDLPTDRPRPPVQTFRGSRESFALSPSLSRAVLDFARSEGATLFMTLLAAFKLLLSRYSRQDDIVVGTPIANRHRAEVEALIGFFVNTLVLRTDLSEDQSFRTLLQKVKETALGAYAHQDVPFERLVEALRPKRDMSRTPVFQVVFVLQNAPLGATSLPGLTLSAVETESVTAKFDLTLIMSEGTDRIGGVFEYNSDLFDGATIAGMARQLEVLLAAVVASPDRALHRFPLLSEADRDELVYEWNDTRTDYPREATIHSLFEAQARRAPDALAVAFEDETLTYAELDRRANQLAHRLVGLGIQADSLVGLALPRSIEMIVATLGILKAGGAYVPFDLDYPAERIVWMMQDAGVKVLVTDAEQAEKLPPHEATLVRLDVDRESIEREREDSPTTATKATSLAYVMYTSGSTGTPKGVAVVHRGVVRLVQNTDYVDLSSNETFLQYAPISFDASTLEIWGALLNGGRLLVFPPGKASFAELGEALVDGGVTTAWLTAGLFNAMMETYPKGLARLRQLLVGGEALSVPHILRALTELPAVRLINGYGPTEGTTFTCCHTIEDAGGASIPIGRPIANTQVFILDPHGAPTPVGVPGELYIGGDGLARGYWNRPELSAERFVPNVFSTDADEKLYRTGDLVRWKADRTVEFLGRLDHQVKVRGYRIELGEIETALGKCEGVGDAVVLAREDIPGDKRLVAYLVPKAGASLDTAEIKQFLQAKMPGFMVPSAFVELAAMPLSPNGKLDRRALPAPTSTGAEAEYVAPESEVEAALAAIWKELLGVDKVGVDDDFFNLGGHSLLAARLVAEIESRLGVAIPLAALFSSRTIRELAILARPEALPPPPAAEMDGEWPSLVTIQAKGTKPPFFAVSRPNINALGYVALARHLGDDQPVYGLQGQFREQTEIGPYTEEEYGEVAEHYLKEMRQVQPKGPYYLGGMCEGAHIAIAIARQLEAEGEEVGLVAILDAWPWENTHIKSLVALHNMNMSLYRLNQMRQMGHNALLVARLASTLRRKLRGAAAMAFGAKVTRKRESVAPPEAKQTVFEARMYPGPDFEPSPIKARIGVFRVRQQPYWRIRDYQLGWEGRTTGGVEVHLIAGGHMTFLREPHVGVLALKLAAALRRLQDARRQALAAGGSRGEEPKAAE